MRDTDQSHTKILKSVTAGSIAAATASAVKACPTSGRAAGLQPSGISVKVCDEVNGQVILLTNESDVARTLVAIQPFKIYTKNGSVDLRKLFDQGAVRISEHSTQSFELQVTGEASRHASWRALVPINSNTGSSSKLQPVDVVSSVTGELRHARTRKHLALFA